MACLLFGNAAFQSNVSEQTKTTTFPSKGKDALCLVSRLNLSFLDSWIWLSFGMYHRIQNKFAQVRGPAGPTVAVAVTQAGFPFQQQMTGMAYPASLLCGLFLLPVERGHKLTSKAKFLEEVAFFGTDRRRVHAATCTKCWVSWAWGDARTRHLFADPKQLPASWEETIPAHQSSVCALCPSQHK